MLHGKRVPDLPQGHPLKEAVDLDSFTFEFTSPVKPEAPSEVPPPLLQKIYTNDLHPYTNFLLSAYLMDLWSVQLPEGTPQLFFEDKWGYHEPPPR